MARKPWRPRSGLSGPQPTFASQGKAPTSGWGVRRAKRGTGAVSREGAFPEGSGQRLALSSTDENESDESPAARVRKRLPAAASSAAVLARCTAAEARALRPPDLFLPADRNDDDDDDLKPLVSPHASDVEPDSDDPDRDSSRVLRTRAAAAAAGAATAPREEEPVPAEDPLAEMRRLRAEAAARRAERSRIVQVLDSEEEARVRDEERRRLDAGPQLVGLPRGRVQSEEKGRAKGKTKGKKGAGKGRRLDEADESDNALRGLEAFKRRKAARGGPGAPIGVARETGKGKGKATDSFSDPGMDDDDDIRAAFPADDLPDPAGITAHARPRASTSARGAFPEPASDARAQRRARTSGRATAAFVNDTDDEREADARAGGALIATGGAGAGPFRVRAAQATGEATGKAAGSLPAAAAARESSADEAPPRPHAHCRPSSASASPRAAVAPATEDYSHLGIPDFVDPRATLARRKKRKLPSPPTSAFSSSDGGDNLTPRSKAPDEFAAVEKRMRRKKRAYRVERGPGYSNPRRN
ncbi:hypothetical protein JCM3770_000759 [Rhodotorula araucariae]